MTQNLFNSDPADDLPKIDDNKDYLNELVGDGKKFKTVDDLAKGKYLADAYVEHQNRQLDELRAEYRKLYEDNARRATLEDQLTQLRQQLTSSNNTPPANEDLEQPQSTIDMKQIESLVSNKVLEHERTKKEEENWNIVVSRLKEKLGPNFSSVLKQQIQELGLTEDSVNQLARTSPKALFKTLGIDEHNTNNFQAPMTSQMRHDSFAPRGKDKRTYSYYQDMKKKDPLVYLDSKTQTQMHKDALEQGEAFFDV